MNQRIFNRRPSFMIMVFTAFLLAPLGLHAQGGRGGRGPTEPPPAAKTIAPIDLAGYWVSIIVDEWRFRVAPQKGEVDFAPPVNGEALRIAKEWDPAKDEAEGKQCKAYGAIGLMQRPGRLHFTWEDDNTLRLDADAGTQTRRFHFGRGPTPSTEPSWQGYSTAAWQIPAAGRGAPPLGDAGRVVGDRLVGGQAAPGRTGTLKVTTSQLLPGYIRKNGIPYSGEATVTEYFNVLPGIQGDTYLVVTPIVTDPVYLNQPYIRSYTFKKQTDASGWDPTSCLTR